MCGRKPGNVATLERDSLGELHLHFSNSSCLCRLPEAEHFLVARAHYLESLPANGESHHALSTTYHRLHQYGTALSYARLAVGDDPGNQEMAWNLELLVRQNNVVQKRNAQISTLNLATDLKMPQPTQVIVYVTFQVLFIQYC